MNSKTLSQLTLSKKKIIALSLVMLLASAVALLLYIQSFDIIEPVCENKQDSQAFRLNYVHKNGLRKKILAHNKQFTYEGKQYTRIYLLHPLLRIPDPIYGDEYDYNPDGCDGYDNMDIYCEVRFNRSPDGKVQVWYNFME